MPCQIISEKNSLKCYKKAIWIEKKPKSCYNEAIEFLERVDVFLITPTYEWQFAPQVEDADFTKMVKKAGLGPEVARLLFERGIM